MRRTLKLLLLLGIGLALMGKKDGPSGTPGEFDKVDIPPKFEGLQGNSTPENQDAIDGKLREGDPEGDSNAEDTSSDSDNVSESDSADTGPFATEGDLEGQHDVQIEDPNNPSDTITDIDRVQDGVLWEEKSATSAGDPEKWVQKHIYKKFASYVRAQQYMEGYEDAPIGFNFTEPGATPEFRAEVEAAISDLQQQYPDIDIRTDWA